MATDPKSDTCLSSSYVCLTVTVDRSSDVFLQEVLALLSVAASLLQAKFTGHRVLSKVSDTNYLTATAMCAVKGGVG